MPQEGDCIICDNGHADEVHYRLSRGESLRYIADKMGFTHHMSIENHKRRGHVPDWVQGLAEWNKSHPDSMQLERARTAAVEKPEKVTQEMVNATLLSLAQRGMKLLDKMEADADYRGSVQAIESLRRTAMDLATMNNLRGGDQKEDVESTDVVALRESILNDFRRKMLSK